MALVTGSSRGLGRAIALRLAGAGADVVVHYRDERAAAEYGEADGPEPTVAAIRSLGGRCLFVAGDVSDRAAVDRFTQRALAEFGRIDILVNCAGGDIGAAGGKPEPNDCLGVPNVDVQAIRDSTCSATIHVLPRRRAADDRAGEGKIVNVASVAGEMGTANGSIYAVAKAGKSSTLRAAWRSSPAPHGRRRQLHLSRRHPHRPLPGNPGRLAPERFPGHRLD